VNMKAARGLDVILGLAFLAFGASQGCSFTGCEQQGRIAVMAPHRPVSNGCSVPSFIQLPDFQFEKCCDLHDACYQSCGVQKEECEKYFERCLKSHCRETHPGNEECVGTANTFVAGVRMFGCNGYQTSQESSCECVPAKDARAANERALTSFYKRYNSTKTTSEIAHALDKNKGHEGKMWHALFRKYPDSIEIISRDGQAQTKDGRGSEL
jgi:hypothetical protein